MDQEIDKDTLNNDQQPLSPPKRKGLINKGKKFGKDLLKNTGQAFKSGLRNAMKVFAAKAKLILILVIIFFIFIAILIDILAQSSVKAANESISTYITSLPSDSKSAKLYTQTGSLLLATDSDIEKISQSFLEETQLTNNILYTLMSEKYKTGALSINIPYTAVSVKQGRTLYEHLLNAERYNFNNIKWVKYTRSTEDGEPETQVDGETRLRYPKDNKGTSLTSFANQMQPYLQNYIVPYSIYVGLVADGRIQVAGYDKAEGYDESTDESVSRQFAYEMLKETYHDIQVNQYNIKNHTIVTKDIVYDLMKLTVTHTVTYNKDGEETSNTYSTPIISTKKFCEHQTDKPEVIDEYDTWDIRYCVKYAKMFDKHVINEYQYTEYNLENEPDDQTLTRDIYKDDNYIQYETSNYNIPSDEYTYTYYKDGGIKKKTATYTMDMKKGYTEIITSTWKDVLEQLSHEERSYTTEDVQETLGDEKLSSTEKTYYKSYEYNLEKDFIQSINLFDIANSKKSVYETYLKEDEEYSKNIGYPRSWFVFSFNTLEQSIKDIEETETGWKYFYGFSMGATEATGASTNGTSSILANVDYSNLPNGKLGWPSPGHTTISSGFRDRGGSHDGIDISMPTGSTFVASANGEVVEAVTTCTDNYSKAKKVSELKPASAYCGGGAGNYVKIKVDGSEMYLIYMHMTDVTVKKGDKVTAGQAIGTCGSTGRSTGPHAHFEVRVGGAASKYAVDPMPLLQKDYNSN